MNFQADKAVQFRQRTAAGRAGASQRLGRRHARIFEEAGFPAIATTSAELLFARYPDGQRIPRRRCLPVSRVLPAL
jgi:2-methylisocitrate lyase-like PEP mutase family enzyme